MTEQTKENIRFAVTILTGISALVSIYYQRKSILAFEARVAQEAKKITNTA